ncbi:hypothetical protein BC829DRAFT_423346 [Chytridium lagenaria]|nr:hypothetical protein BC829DRAFT_423346 [Chytridium lagenaria]
MGDSKPKDAMVRRGKESIKSNDVLSLQKKKKEQGKRKRSQLKSLAGFSVKDEVPKSGIRGGILGSVGDRGNGFLSSGGVEEWSHRDKSIMSDISRRRVAAEALVSLVKERGLRDEDEGPERRWRYWRRRRQEGYLARIRMVFVITDGSNGCGGGVGARLTIDINDRPLISTYEGMVGREANLNAGAARKGLSHCWYQRWRRWRRRRGSLQGKLPLTSLFHFKLTF